MGTCSSIGCSTKRVPTRALRGRFALIEEQTEWPETAKRQKPLCFTQNGKSVYFTATTTNCHKQPAPDGKLVAQLPPLRVPDDWYYWYSADQAADQSLNDQNCVEIGGNGKLQCFTEATLSNHPDGKAKDYVYVGKGNSRAERSCE